MDLSSSYGKTKYSLACHTGMLCPAVRILQVTVALLPKDDLHLRYELCGDLSQLLIPAPQASMASDGLWQHSCFEAFIAVEGEAAYREFNFSPSSQWAAYAFSDYRLRSPWSAREAPTIRVARTKEYLSLEALVAAGDLPPNSAGKPLQLGLTAVLEAKDGGLSYWALHHPTAKPDFHHRSGFVLSFGQT